MKLPEDWTAERASEDDEARFLIHNECGWRSNLPYDLTINEQTARRIVHGHRCDDGLRLALENVLALVDRTEPTS